MIINLTSIFSFNQYLLNHLFLNSGLQLCSCGHKCFFLGFLFVFLEVVIKEALSDCVVADGREMYFLTVLNLLGVVLIEILL